MVHPLTFFFLLLISLAVLISFFLVYKWWRRSKVTGSKLMILLISLTGFWLLTQGVEIISTALEWKVFWYTMQWLGFTLMPASFLLIVLSFWRAEKKPRKLCISILTIIQFFQLTVIFTNPFHHFFIKKYYLSSVDGFIGLGKVFNFGYWIFLGLNFIILFIGLILLLNMMIHRPGYYSRQIHWLFIGGVSAGLSQFLELFSLNSFSIFPIAPLIMALFILGISANFFTYKKLDLNHMAEPILDSTIPGPVLYLDPGFHLVELNYPASKLLQLDPKRAIGKSLKDIAPEIFEKISLSEMKEDPFIFEFFEKDIKYEGRLSSIHDNNQRVISYILTLSIDFDEKFLFDSLQRTNQLVKALSNVTMQVSAKSTPQEVLETMGEELLKLNIHSAFSTTDKEMEFFITEYISFPLAKIKLLEKAIGISLNSIKVHYSKWPQKSKIAIEKNLPVFQNNFFDSLKDFFDGVEKNTLSRALSIGNLSSATRSVYVPLKFSDGSSGLITVWGETVQEQDLMAYSVFGSQITTAFEQAQLRELAKKNIEENKRSNEIIHVLSQMALSTIQIQRPLEIFDVLAKELGKLGLYYSYFSVNKDFDMAAIEYMSLDPKTTRALEIAGGVTAFGYQMPKSEWSPLAVKAIESQESIYCPRLIDELTFPFLKFGKSLVQYGLKLVNVDDNDSGYYVPLKNADNSHGMLLIWGKQLYEADLPAYTIFSQQISSVLDNAKQRERENLNELELDHSHGLIRSLSDVGAQISATSDPDKIMELMGAELKTFNINCLVALHEKERDEIYIRFHSMNSKLLRLSEKITGQKFHEQRVPLTYWPDLIVTVFKSGEAVYVKDFIHSTMSFMSGIPTPIAGKSLNFVGVTEKTRAYYLPLEVKGNVFGCLALWGDDLRANDLPAFSVFSNQVAGAFETARLYEAERVHAAELNRSNALLQSLSKTAVGISSLTRFEDILELLKKELSSQGLSFNYIQVDDKLENARIQYFSNKNDLVGQPGNQFILSVIQKSIPKVYWTQSVIEAAEENKAIFLPNYSVAMRPYFQQVSDSLYKRGLKLLGISEKAAGIILPLIALDGSVGFLFIWGETLREGDMSTFNVFRKQIESTIENQRLFQKAEEEIAERIEIQASLYESREEYRGLFQNAHDAIIIFEPKTGRVLEVNPRACEMYGYQEEELNRLSIFSIYKDEEYGRSQIHDVLNLKQTANFEVTQHHKNGSEMILDINATNVKYRGKNAVLTINRDITDRKRIEAQLQFSALHDSLTNLPNRNLLYDRLEHVIAHSSRSNSYSFAILFIDLDQFKDVNDSLGHPFGDELLIEVAARLIDCLRTVDTVARFGGDEFVILLDEIKNAFEIPLLCNRILATIARPFVSNGRTATVTGSIGVVMGGPEYREPQEYLRDADIALYSAKGLGRAQYSIFNPDMRDMVIQRLKLEGDLRQAVKNDELVLNYQAVVNLNDRSLQGFEALVRWEKPDGYIMPDSFIPLAEDTGIIHELGRWVLLTACQQMAVYQVSCPQAQDLIINVNVSAIQLLRDDFPLEVQEVLKLTGLNPVNLALEITETAIILDQEAASRQLKALREIGVHLYLDDFGTGYSSLSFLNQFPIDALKIDRQFLASLDIEKQQDLVNVFIILGRKLGMKVIVEGVEEEWQNDILMDLGGEFGQGYLFSKPVDFETLMAANVKSNNLPVLFHRNNAKH
jgi:diguanylate cyclase (GGDEF)-like protein/PAS domain S-box-containing protein